MGVEVGSEVELWVCFGVGVGVWLRVYKCVFGVGWGWFTGSGEGIRGFWVWVGVSVWVGLECGLTVDLWVGGGERGECGVRLVGVEWIELGVGVMVGVV